MTEQPQRIVIFASGRGSNAAAICAYFHAYDHIQVAGIFTNKVDAGVIEVATKFRVPHFIFNREEWRSPDFKISNYISEKVDLIVLAGFLWQVPVSFLENHSAPVINIHPSLLPKYGGKGMFGMHVHEAVKAAGENETGITIHKVTAKYDEGPVLFQAKCSIDPNDEVDTIRKKVQGLEYIHFPKVIEFLLTALKVV